MKTKNLVIGLAVVVALAAAFPALAATNHGRQGRAGSASANDSRARRLPHAYPGKRKAASAAIPSAPFTVEPLTGDAKSELARTGSVVLPISFGGPGTVLATGEASIGTATTTAIGTAPDGHSEAIEVPRDSTPAIRPASVTATAAGTEDLTISLTPWASSELAAGHDVEMVLMLSPAQGPSESAPALAMLVELPGS